MTTVTFTEEIKLENLTEPISVQDFFRLAREQGFYIENDTYSDLDFKIQDYEELTTDQKKSFNEVDTIPNSQLYNL